MTKDKIIQLFPLKGYISQEIIDASDPQDIQRCQGARTLKAALPEEFEGLAMWAYSAGSIHIDGYYLGVTTKEVVDFPSVKKPKKVTFILVE